MTSHPNPNLPAGTSPARGRLASFFRRHPILAALSLVTAIAGGVMAAIWLLHVITERLIAHLSDQDGWALVDFQVGLVVVVVAVVAVAAWAFRRRPDGRAGR